jgi:cytochrome oxidase Cu insertion factor (SCO1/SenC/PrrC family)
VILAFLAARATGASPLIAEQIRGALDDLGTAAGGGGKTAASGTATTGGAASSGADGVAALAVTVDPGHDTPARVRAFLSQTSLRGRLRYLVGSPAELRRVWRAYRVVPAAAGRGAAERAAFVLLIDRRGRERVEFGLEQLTPEGLEHDARRLLGEAG